MFLVDENLKIRWAGCGDAMAEETQALENCTGVLLRRLDKLLLEAGNGDAKAKSEQVSGDDLPVTP